MCTEISSVKTKQQKYEMTHVALALLVSTDITTSDPLGLGKTWEAMGREYIIP
jgi:hypothetical protein